jgi:DNA-binding response OmpR family regulator
MNNDRKVLIVDDDTELIKVMKIYFQNSGFTTEVVESGRKALKAVEKFQPDVMILDVLMPKMDGVQVCETVRRQMGNAAMPIIALTGYHKEQTKREIIAAGANMYLTKPIDMSELLRHVKQMLAGRSNEIGVGEISITGPGWES